MKLRTPEDTRALGMRLASVLRAGDLILLVGPLGAGKTALTQGIGAGLGVRAPITSPTFVISRVHRDGRLPLVHVDAYRVGGRLELDDLDLDASVEDSVTVVEWGEGIAEQLSDSYLEVHLDRLDRSEGDTADETRVARLVGVGGDWADRVASL